MPQGGGGHCQLCLCRHCALTVLCSHVHKAKCLSCPTVCLHAEGAPEGACCGELVAASTGGQISSRLLSLRSANLLLEIPQAEGVLPAGTRVSALVLGDLGAMPVLQKGQEIRFNLVRFLKRGWYASLRS